jgi:hypothetical protein
MDLGFSWKFQLSRHFWINFVDIEMAIGVIVDNNELHIKIECRLIGQYLTELWPLDLQNFMVFSFFQIKKKSLMFR